MARSRTVTPVTTTVTVDAVDRLVTALNTLEGIAFVRDAWENKAPDNYGVVEVDGAPMNLWGDDKLLSQVFQLRIHAYVDGSRDDLVALVQAKLESATDWFSLIQHEFLMDVNKNHWVWTAQVIGPLQWTTEVVTSG